MSDLLSVIDTLYSGARHGKHEEKRKHRKSKKADEAMKDALLYSGAKHGKHKENKHKNTKMMPENESFLSSHRAFRPPLRRDGENDDEYVDRYDSELEEFDGLEDTIVPTGLSIDTLPSDAIFSTKSDAAAKSFRELSVRLMEYAEEYVYQQKPGVKKDPKEIVNAQKKIDSAVEKISSAYADKEAGKIAEEIVRSVAKTYKNFIRVFSDFQAARTDKGYSLLDKIAESLIEKGSSAKSGESSQETANIDKAFKDFEFSLFQIYTEALIAKDSVLNLTSTDAIRLVKDPRNDLVRFFVSSFKEPKRGELNTKKKKSEISGRFANLGLYVYLALTGDEKKSLRERLLKKFQSKAQISEKMSPSASQLARLQAAAKVAASAVGSREIDVKQIPQVGF